MKKNQPNVVESLRADADAKVSAWRDAKTSLDAATAAQARVPLLPRSAYEAGRLTNPTPLLLAHLKAELVAVEAKVSLAIAEYHAITALDALDLAEGFEPERHLSNLRADLTTLEGDVRKAEEALTRARQAVSDRARAVIAAEHMTATRRAAVKLPYRAAGFNPGDQRAPYVVQINDLERRRVPPNFAGVADEVRGRIVACAAALERMRLDEEAEARAMAGEAEFVQRQQEAECKKDRDARAEKLQAREAENREREALAAAYLNR